MIELGKSKAGFPVYVNENGSMNNHILLVGGTGSGKTVLAQKIMLEIVKDGGRALALNYHGCLDEDQIFEPLREEFDTYKHDIFAYTEGIPCPLFKPIVFPNGVEEDKTDTIGAITDVICRAAELEKKEQIALRTAVEMVYEYGTFELSGFKAIGEALQSDGSSAALDTFYHLRGLVSRQLFIEGNTLFEDRKINVVHLSQFDLVSQDVISELLLAYVWRQANAGMFKKNPIYVFIDEAQNYISTSKGTLAQMISEGRKMGVNLILSTQLIIQSSTKAVQQRLTQCGLMLYGRPVANKVHYTAMMVNPTNTRDVMKELKKLRVGQFLADGSFLVGTIEVNYPIVVDARIESKKPEETSRNTRESEESDK